MEGHDVYLGTTFEDVNDASRADPRGVLVSEGQDIGTFDPGLLGFDETYYWRIDEVGDPSESTIFRDSVWSFTTEPYAYPVDNSHITAAASGEQPGMVAQNTINGSGLAADDSHSTVPSDMWLTGGVFRRHFEVNSLNLFKLRPDECLHSTRVTPR